MTRSLAEWVRVREHVFELYFSIITSNPEKFLAEYTLTPALRFIYVEFGEILF